MLLKNSTFASRQLPAVKYRLWYEYYDGPNLARVIPDPDGSKYGGNISIPGQIEYGGITYSVVQIGARAFDECTDLKSVTLGEGIEYIAAFAFYNCPNLESITFSSTMGLFNTVNPNIVFRAL